MEYTGNNMIDGDDGKHSQSPFYGDSEDEEQCEKCEGKGVITEEEDCILWSVPCDNCDGKGFILIEKDPDESYDRRND